MRESLLGIEAIESYFGNCYNNIYSSNIHSFRIFSVPLMLESKPAAKDKRISTDTNPAYGLTRSSNPAATSPRTEQDTSAYEMCGVDSKPPQETIYEDI